MVTLRMATAWCLSALVLCSLSAQAGVGLAELPGRSGNGPVTVFYPSVSATAPVQRGPFSFQLARQGAPERGNGRLIVLSHGSGGSPWPQADLAQYLVSIGFVVAMPEHAGDNWHDMDKVGPASWKLRPAEVSAAIDSVADDPRFAGLLDLARVGMYGMSAGGHTALTLAGGRWSPQRLLEHCEAHLADDFVACTGAASELKGNGWDGIKKAVAAPLIRWNLRGDSSWYGHTDPRIRAVVAGVPFAADFDPATLAAPSIPLGIVQAGRDLWLVPRFHSAAVLSACASCELVADLAQGGHGALLAPLPTDTPPRIARVLADPPGFDRTALPDLYRRIGSFFIRQLLP